MGTFKTLVPAFVILGIWLNTAFAQTITPYISDPNTVLLDHFDGSTLASKAVGTVNYVSGPSGLDQAADFSQGGWLRYTITPWADPTTGTLEAWVYARSLPASLLVLQWYDVNSPPGSGFIGGFSLGGSDYGTNSVIVPTWPNGSWAVNTEATIPTNAWFHLAVTWDPTGTTIYVNGVPEAFSTTDYYPALSNPTYLYLGYWGISSSDQYAIDELRIRTITPEPTTWGLLVLGIGAVFGGRILRRRSS